MRSWQLGPAWLFCPADRPDRFAKALERADVAILDLEDAVAPGRKAAAREALAAYTGYDGQRMIVRLNPAGSPEHDRDLDLVAALGITRVMLAKAQTPADLAGLAGCEVIVLLETPAGVVNARELLAADPVIGAMWGAEDLVAGLGGTASRDADGHYRPVAVHAQSTTLLAAKAAGKLAIDAVHLAITDHAGLGRESADAAACGFDAKALIHPGHVPIVRAAFAPTAEQLAWARRILAATAEHGEGVFALDELMVDGPIVAQARRLIARVPTPPA